MAKGKYREWLEPQNLKLIKSWKLEGLSDKQIAEDKIGIHESTLYDWANRFPEFAEAIKSGREFVAAEVENAMYKSSQGYDVEEETWERVYNKSTGEYELALTKKTVKHVPPNTTAQIFMLKNIKKQVWRDKQDLAVTGAVPVVIKDDVNE